MKEKYTVLLLFVFLLKVSDGYSQYFPSLNIPVYVSGSQLTLPWTGGFDAVSFIPVEMNGDGIKDLFCFEKSGASGKYYRYSTFINYGTPDQVDYHYEPLFAEKFPAGMSQWVVGADYNCDGKEDLFAFNDTGGMDAYRNDYDSITGLTFTKEYTLIQTVYSGVPNYLQIFPNSQPAFADVDNDSDLDVITFPSSGFTVEYHKNLAKENFNRCDTLVFELFTECWGNFELNSFSNSAALGISCFAKPGFSLSKNDYRKSLHAGSCAITPDLDGDGDKEMLNGDILGDNILYLENGGDTVSANMVLQDSLFPAYDVPVNFTTFPAPYYFDADNDGAKDLIVTSCLPSASRNFNNVLFYKNTTDNATNEFSYVQDDLLVGQMIDVGSRANVTMTDIDADGLQDMIIGNFDYVYQGASYSCQIAYFRNNGTATSPSFELVTTDFASVSTLGILNAYPSFGDLDNDGDKDMIVGALDGYLNYFENMAGNFVLTIPHINSSAGTPIDMGGNAAPVIVDLNRDGKLDVVIGESNGNLNYFENTGTVSSFSFTLITDSLGGVDVVKHGEDIYGYSAPFFYDSLGTYKLFTGSLSGYVYLYDNIDNNLSGNFNLVDSMLIYEPVQSSVTGTDINADGKLDLLVGNFSGGVKWYSDLSTGVIPISGTAAAITIYPNPASDQVNIHINQLRKPGLKQIEITGIAGNVIYRSSFQNSIYRLSTVGFANGIYFIRISDKTNSNYKKMVVRHY